MYTHHIWDDLKRPPKWMVPGMVHCCALPHSFNTKKAINVNKYPMIPHNTPRKHHRPPSQDLQMSHRSDSLHSHLPKSPKGDDALTRLRGF